MVLNLLQLPGEALLTPTKIYSRLLLPILQSGAVKAYAHITGGGLLENIPRVIPRELAVDIGDKHDILPILELFRLPCWHLLSCSDASRWSIPSVFSWLYKEGGLSEAEMTRTFNCGLGAVLVVSPIDAQKVLHQLHAEKTAAWIVGSLAHKQPGEKFKLISCMFFLSLK